MNWAVFIRGPKGKKASCKLFWSFGEAEEFRIKVARLHPEVNTFTAVLHNDDGSALNWALEQ